MNLTRPKREKAEELRQKELKDKYPIYGNVYVKKSLKLHQQSFHFDFTGDGPYISYDTDLPSDWKLDNDEKPPKKMLFKDINFDKDSRSLTAKIDWAPRTFWDVQTEEFTMVFSEDYKKITGGSWIEKDKNGAQQRDSVEGLKQYALHVEKKKKGEKEEPKKALSDP
jgi:hypothetical protein